MTKIKKCASCNRYTLGDRCDDCGSGTTGSEPPTFSVPDRYGDYRRQSKKEGNT